MKKTKFVVIALLLLGAGIVYLIGTQNVNTNLTITSAQTKPTVENENDKNFPIVSWETSDQSRNLDEKRQKKDSRFEGTKWVEKNVYDTDRKSILTTHWQIGLSAIPTKESDTVVIGTVESAEAFLCNDNGSIYSEFSIKIANVLKDTKDAKIKIEDNILIDRMGGQVKYPTGRIFKYEIRGQGMPRLSGRYVFFLRFDKERDMYILLTAYEILDGRIIALDGQGASKGSGFNFTDYDGIGEFEFLNKVRDAGREGKEEKLP